MDAVIVGSGPNGLAAAIAIARAGRSVQVVESRQTPGGAARSGELTLPGFVHDLGSAIHPLAAASPFFRQLPLERHGLQWIEPEIALAHPLDDGSAAVLVRSLDETCARMGADAEAYGRIMSPLLRRWPALTDEFLQPLVHVPRHPILMAQFGVMALQAASGFVRRHFRTAGVRALFAGIAAHSFLPLDASGSAAFGLVLGLMAHAVGWPLPKGGAQSITQALCGHLTELGGRVLTGQHIHDLRDLPAARATLLDLTAWQAAAIAGDRFPEHYRRRLARFPHGPGVFKLDYAIDGPIPWKAEACGSAGTVHLGGAWEEIAESEEDVANGRAPLRPFVLLAQQSLFDPTRAPAGKHTVWAYCHVPFGSDADMSDRIEAQIERFAPGFRKRILHRTASSPKALEQLNPNLTGGDISGGASHLWNLAARPTLGFTPYRTPANGLYLCSSSTPPGGGVHGMCGFHAAQAALSRELR